MINGAFGRTTRRLVPLTARLTPTPTTFWSIGP
jgi:hypothetical protein